MYLWQYHCVGISLLDSGGDMDVEKLSFRYGYIN